MADEKQVAPRAKPALIPQPRGGALYAGGVPGHAGGSGRPRDAFRAALRKLSQGKGLPFLNRILDGEIPVAFVGECPSCHTSVHEPDLDGKYVQRLREMIERSIDQQLRANEQALKYGLGTVTETVSIEDMQAQAQQMLDVMVNELTAKGWSVADVQALAMKMADGALSAGMEL